MRNVAVLFLFLSAVVAGSLVFLGQSSPEPAVIVYGEKEDARIGLVTTLLRPNVARFLRAYQHPRLSRPAERLCLPLSKIHDQLSEPSPAPGVRRQLMILETGLRLYKKAHPELKPVLAEVKALEDTYGSALDAAHTADLGRQYGAPARVQAVLDQRVASTDLELSRMIQARWTPTNDGRIPAVKDVLIALAATPFAIEEKDAAYIRKRFRSKLKKLSKETYVLSTLEGNHGVHELRRDLRWILYFAVSTDGVIQFTQGNESDETPAHAGLPSYAWLPRPDIDTHHMYLSAETYKSAFDATYTLASVKESWELMEAFERAFLESNAETRPEMARRAALKLMGRPPTEAVRLVDEAKRIYAEIIADDLFLSLRRDLKKAARCPRHGRKGLPKRATRRANTSVVPVRFNRIQRGEQCPSTRGSEPSRELNRGGRSPAESRRDENTENPIAKLETWMVRANLPRPFALTVFANNALLGSVNRRTSGEMVERHGPQSSRRPVGFLPILNPVPTLKSSPLRPRLMGKNESAVRSSDETRVVGLAGAPLAPDLGALLQRFCRMPKPTRERCPPCRCCRRGQMRSPIRPRSLPHPYFQRR